MTWINKRVLRVDDRKQGTIIKVNQGYLGQLIIQIDDGTEDETYLYPWAVVKPNRFMFLSYDECWINLNGHEHNVS